MMHAAVAFIQITACYEFYRSCAHSRYEWITPVYIFLASQTKNIGDKLMTTIKEGKFWLISGTYEFKDGTVLICVLTGRVYHLYVCTVCTSI